MKFSAFMFIRNGIHAGYTFMEAVENVLPFVDEFFILEGKSDDRTCESLELFSKKYKKVVIESKLPEYVHAKKDERGVLLGAAFEEARQKCDGDWLIQVQADTVFHPITVLAARYFLMQKNNKEKYDAIKILRRQYRWNWQDMYREDILNLIFKKSSGKVFGDAIDITVEGSASKNLLPLFRQYPATDNAWIFFENIMGKIESCSEIWEDQKDNVLKKDFPWYNEATKRSFKKDKETYLENGAPPPFWQTNTSPFKKSLPENLLCHIGKYKYEVAKRFTDKESIYNPAPADILCMIDRVKSDLSPFSKFIKRRG